MRSAVRPLLCVLPALFLGACGLWPGGVPAPETGPAAEAPAPWPASAEVELRWAPLDDGLLGKPGFRFQALASRTSSPESPTGFTTSLNLSPENVFYNRAPLLQESPWTAIEMRVVDGEPEPVALYLDLNGDGELQAGERSEMVVNPEADGRMWLAVTGKFQVAPPAGGEPVPYRFVLGIKPERFPMWSTACALAGDANLGGRRLRLMLFDNDVDAAWDGPEKDVAHLAPPETIEAARSEPFLFGGVKEVAPGVFYRLAALERTGAETWRAVLERVEAAPHAPETD